MSETPVRPGPHLHCLTQTVITSIGQISASAAPCPGDTARRESDLCPLELRVQPERQTRNQRASPSTASGGHCCEENGQGEGVGSNGEGPAEPGKVLRLLCFSEWSPKSQSWGALASSCLLPSRRYFRGSSLSLFSLSPRSTSQSQHPPSPGLPSPPSQPPKPEGSFQNTNVIKTPLTTSTSKAPCGSLP